MNVLRGNEIHYSLNLKGMLLTHIPTDTKTEHIVLKAKRAKGRVLPLVWLHFAIAIS